MPSVRRSPDDTGCHLDHPEPAVLLGGGEAARAPLNADLVDGPVATPEQMRAAALQWAMAFAGAGIQTG